MRDFEKLFLSSFENIKVGKPKQLKFCDDALKRLISAVGAGAPFSILVSPTQIAFDNLLSSLNTTTSTFAQQQSRTLTVDNILKSFKILISKREATIRGLCDTDTPEYQEIFPQGLTQYTKINKSTAPILMNQLCSGITNNVVVLGQSMLDEFKQLLVDYLKAREMQELKKGTTEQGRSSWDECIAIMYLQFNYNLLTIAREYPGQPEKAKIYFDQNILRLHKHTAQDGGEQPLTEQIAPLATLTPIMKFAATDTILLSNVSDVASIFYYGGNTINQAPATTPIELLCGEEVEIPAATLGKYLILLNKDIINIAEVELMLV